MISSTEFWEVVEADESQTSYARLMVKGTDVTCQPVGGGRVVLNSDLGIIYYKRMDAEDRAKKLNRIWNKSRS